MPETNNPLEKFSISLITSVFSKRQDGNMSLSYGDTKHSLENRQKFLSSIGIDYQNLVGSQQIHGKEVRYIKDDYKGKGALNYDSSIPDTDGLMTDKKGLPLMILTADCLSVFIYDPKKPAVALLHAGWRGTLKNIASEGVKALQEKFGSSPQRLFVGFGPSIRSCCFEVEKDFNTDFPFGLVVRDGRTYMDIALMNKQQLINCGVQEKNIFDPEICTFSQNQDYFSFRKEGDKSGRMISVIMLKP